ncbi:lamina-associated polypeptide 2, isoforms beta/delta/epsilon/gamma-like [Xyrauchen texanus]|uniref:lamina-associated polypeptide 2, isoforms beta/delta/epsilon/gamma-like n=1 Tax=Xyrauchen texanus TaxID=154827 RepID=UPI00224212BE|nr:lamina-associated polypeptide 2, isoforms beta/delta/epsilon/gamma-like [Xyrauchen texanus]
MAQYLEDPASLTKEKLKSELMANKVPLPSADSKKDVYVQLYLKNLTVLNKKNPPADTFSSDDDTAPVLSNRSRSGKKATRKTERVWADQKDVFGLTDEELKVQLLKYGVNSGPIVASTRKVYEKKLQRLQEQPPSETTLPEPETTVPETVTIKPDGNQNGNTHSAEDQYSDKEGEVESIPEPPIATKPVRSRGKTPVTTRTSSRQRTKQVDETASADVQESTVDGEDILKNMFPNEPATPTGIMATCRRPIHGAAGRPVKPLNLWSEEPLLQQNVYTATKSSVTDICASAPAVRPRSRCSFSFWLMLLTLLALAASLYYIFQNATADQISTCQLFVQDNVITPIINYISWESK